MPRASHLFRSFAQARGLELTVEEHSAEDTGDLELLLGEKTRIMNLEAKNMKYQIAKLSEIEVKKTKQKIKSLILKYSKCEH